MFSTFGINHVYYLALAGRFTLLLFAVAFIGGSIGGAVLAILATVPSPKVNWFARAVIYVVQGIPLLVLLFVAYFGLTSVGLDVPPLAGAALAMTIFAGAFLGEIWRGAIGAVAKGQWEAAFALGLGWGKTMRLVVAPQAVRAAIPPTVGFLVQLIKNTALASIIGFIELTRAGQIVANSTFEPLPVFLTVGAMYFVICYPLSCASRYLEFRLATGHALRTLD